MIHYKNKSHPRYPATGCGRTSITTETSSIIDRVDCKMCIKSYERHMNGLDGRRLRKFNHFDKREFGREDEL